MILLTSCHRGGKHRHAGQDTPQELTEGQASADQLLSEQSAEALEEAPLYPDTVVIRYAKGLRISYESDGIHLLISDPDPQARHHAPQEFIVTTPSHRIVCTTALQLGNFEALGLEPCVVGINTMKNLFSPKVREQIRSGQTVEIGREGVFDTEAVIASKPDYILVSASKHGGFDVLRHCGIPLIPHHGYRETDPLGQAEWVKLIGVLTGETRRANALFADIERKYLRLKEEVATSIPPEQRPTVASGRQVREGWYVVGGRSYMAHLFNDAGARYVMSDNASSGGVTLDYEAAYAKSVEADFWQIDGRYVGDFTMQALAAEDARYATLRAFKQGRVLFCNLTQTPYRELAPVQPHLLLADFVKAFHPELLPSYTPSYYRLLRKP